MKAVLVAKPPPTGVVVEIENDGAIVLCVVNGAMENFAQGVVLPSPSRVFVLSQKKLVLF